MSDIKLEAGWLRDSIEQAGKKLKQITDQTYSDDDHSAIANADGQSATVGIREPISH